MRVCQQWILLVRCVMQRIEETAQDFFLQAGTAGRLRIRPATVSRSLVSLVGHAACLAPIGVAVPHAQRSFGSPVQPSGHREILAPLEPSQGGPRVRAHHAVYMARIETLILEYPLGVTNTHLRVIPMGFVRVGVIPIRSGEREPAHAPSECDRQSGLSYFSKIYHSLHLHEGDPSC
jgi:hypothetical protein